MWLGCLVWFGGLALAYIFSWMANYVEDESKKELRERLDVIRGICSFLKNAASVVSLITFLLYLLNRYG